MIVLDTHTWWWAISEPDHLSAKAKRVITSAQGEERCVADISLWEFAMMVQRGRILLSIEPEEWLNHAVNIVGTRVLPIIAPIALDSVSLPGSFHKDPADRLIVATARFYKAPVITKDEKILKYRHVKAIW